MGVRVARSLQRPIVNGIKGVEIVDDLVVAHRECNDGFEVYQLSLPAVIGVKEGINLPRYATLPGRLKSKKAEIVHRAIETRNGDVMTSALATPVEQSVDTVVLGNGPDAAAAVVDLLVELGLA